MAEKTLACTLLSSLQASTVSCFPACTSTGQCIGVMCTPGKITNSLHTELCLQIKKPLTAQLERVAFKSTPRRARVGMAQYDEIHMQHTHQSDLRTDEHVRHPCCLATDGYPPGNDWGGGCTDATVPSPACAFADNALGNAETPTATGQSQLLSLASVNNIACSVCESLLNCCDQ